MDLKKYADNLGLDESDFRELTALFVDTSREDVIKLTEAMKDKDFKKAREASHSIKGAAGNLGFMNIWESASDCESASEKEIADIIEVKTKEISEMIDEISKYI